MTRNQRRKAARVKARNEAEYRELAFVRQQRDNLIRANLAAPRERNPWFKEKGFSFQAWPSKDSTSLVAERCLPEVLTRGEHERELNGLPHRSAMDRTRSIGKDFLPKKFR